MTSIKLRHILSRRLRIFHCVLVSVQTCYSHFDLSAGVNSTHHLCSWIFVWSCRLGGPAWKHLLNQLQSSPSLMVITLSLSEVVLHSIPSPQSTFFQASSPSRANKTTQRGLSRLSSQVWLYLWGKMLTTETMVSNYLLSSCNFNVIHIKVVI